MQSSDLRSTLVQKKKTLVCTLKGEISYETVLQLRNIFSEIRDRSPKFLVVDLSELKELGSAGLGEIARLILWCESYPCRMNIVCQSPHIKEVLNISGVEKYAPVFNSAEEAFAQLS